MSENNEMKMTEENRPLTDLELQALMVVADAESRMFDRADAERAGQGWAPAYGGQVPYSVERLSAELKRRGVLS